MYIFYNQYRNKTKSSKKAQIKKVTSINQKKYRKKTIKRKKIEGGSGASGALGASELAKQVQLDLVKPDLINNLLKEIINEIPPEGIVMSNNNISNKTNQVESEWDDYFKIQTDRLSDLIKLLKRSNLSNNILIGDLLLAIDKLNGVIVIKKEKEYKEIKDNYLKIINNYNTQLKESQESMINFLKGNDWFTLNEKIKK